MAVPPSVSVIALRTADLDRFTAFYAAVGWELSPASTAAMLWFKTVILSIHVATDGEVDAALQEAVRAGGVVVKRAAPTPLGGS